MERSERKLRTGKRLNSGSGPMFTTLAPSAKGCLSGHHGARQSSTTTTSAAASQGPGSAPTWQGCSVEIARCVAHHEQTARSEEHTSELQSLMRISYAVFCLKKKKTSPSEHRKHMTPKH